MSSKSLEAQRQYHKRLERAKYVLRDLAGKDAEAAFQRVRQIEEQTKVGWLQAYKQVTNEVRLAQQKEGAK